ncbi:MAG: hypothetical protein ACLFTR_02430 [Candidatus Woesearchaeota archaeon]
MGGIVVVNHFTELWDIISRDNSKIKAFPFFFWIFLPILLFSSAANWFDVRLFLGTIAWILIAYGYGAMIIATGKQRRRHGI